MQKVPRLFSVPLIFHADSCLLGFKGTAILKIIQNSRQRQTSIFSDLTESYSTLKTVTHSCLLSYCLYFIVTLGRKKRTCFFWAQRIANIFLFLSTKKYLATEVLKKQGYKDSNLELTESESVALPFGDSPMCFVFSLALSLATDVII